MTQTIIIEEHTHRRLSTILHELTHSKKRDLTIDDVINELIDAYQESSWTNFGAGAGGG